ncbi:MAG: hypothetical protein GAK28_04846 [Luteibacter sp.]|uniref:DUF3999 family protein n=1 Tax=Luteibacter sp. TaxID=1886636 RepID=UPI00137CC248|nr:DUF3999 family protein [Luteibacter sp.]KAF1003239.1 MAG: hypothetical protein GAK28_04846 [Luteibacter sp.]
MRREWRIASFLFGLTTTVAMAADAPKYAWAYTLDAPAGANAYLLELPRDAYAWASVDAGLADIIVVDSENRPVAMGPYQAAAPTSHPVTLDTALRAVPQTAVGVAGPRIQRNTNGDIVIDSGAPTVPGTPTQWLFDARSRVSPERLEFPASGHDVSLTVDVDASADLQDWTPVARGASLVTLGHGEGAVDARVVKLSGAPMRYYRVNVTKGDAPWDANGGSSVTLSGTVEDASAQDEAALQWSEVSASDSKTSGQGVDYDYDLPAALPVSRVRASLGGGDNVARLDITAVQGPMSGESLGTIVLTPGQAADHPLEVPVARRQHLRVHSGTPLREAPKLAVGWRPDRFVFLPEGKGPYRLLVGSRTERRPNWPIADAIAALRTSGGANWRPVPVTVGPGEELEGKGALDTPAAPFDWTRPLLWIVLLLGAAVVIGMATSLLRKPPPSDSGEH